MLDECRLPSWTRARGSTGQKRTECRAADMQRVVGANGLGDVDRMPHEHAVRLRNVFAVQPHACDGGEPIEAQAHWPVGRGRREPAAIPPVVRVEITRLRTIPPAGGAKRYGHRYGPETWDPFDIQRV